MASDTDEFEACDPVAGVTAAASRANRSLGVSALRADTERRKRNGRKLGFMAK